MKSHVCRFCGTETMTVDESVDLRPADRAECFEWHSGAIGYTQKPETVTATVNPWEIRLCDDLPSRREVVYQMKRLDSEGQIEPLVARHNLGRWQVDNSDWPYATAQVWAARLLRAGIDPDSEWRFSFANITTEAGPKWTLMLTTERD